MADHECGGPAAVRSFPQKVSVPDRSSDPFDVLMRCIEGTMAVDSDVFVDEAA
jgi:hypothetical protein